MGTKGERRNAQENTEKRKQRRQQMMLQSGGRASDAAEAMRKMDALKATIFSWGRPSPPGPCCVMNWTTSTTPDKMPRQ
ncbi:hypothetical protein MRB53_004255 [Persea americana]|uniref:Uncharacterized protein n=1 Tax=Persea americana TaxID=3435 RepID=A0ACC2M9P4_PERAE|nr:hypothetical protein MRB53_004255 [Persea americana]